MADLSLQNFIIARLADYCDYRRPYSEEMRHDPTVYLMRKLAEIDEPISQLKQQLLQDSTSSFWKRLEREEMTNAVLDDYKQLLDSYLAPGDYADAAFHLDLVTLSNPEQRRAAGDFLMNLRAHALLEEEKKPEEQHSKNWARIVSDIYKRLEYTRIEKVLAHKKTDERRLRFILRRCRFNSAEYCAVFHFPSGPEDTFTPFILPRVESLVAANRRILYRIRRSG